jgi:hypothetical protein
VLSAVRQAEQRIVADGKRNKVRPVPLMPQLPLLGCFQHTPLLSPSLFAHAALLIPCCWPSGRLPSLYGQQHRGRQGLQHHIGGKHAANAE